MKHTVPTILLSLAAALQGQQPQFKEQTIDANIQIGYGLAIADVDGDAKTDILLADKNEIAWYQNPSWQKHVIATSLTAKDHVCIAARDIDGDGKAEIAVGAEWNPGDTEGSGAVFYLEAPKDRTQPWKAIRLPHEPTTHRMKWVRTAVNPDRYDLVVVPLHGRGNKNGQGAGVRVLAYQRPADIHATWPTHVLVDTMHATHNLDIIPAPPTEAESLLVCGREGVVRLNPLENGTRWQQQWIARHPTDSQELPGAGEVRYGVLANGMPYVVTIEPMHGNMLALYTPAPSGPKDLPWNRQVLDDSLVDGHALATYDFLGLGNRQIAVGWRAQQKIGPNVGVKFLHTTKETGAEWTTTPIDQNTMACEDLASFDLDGDKDQDLIAAGRRTKNVKIYWNQRK
ncbi:MAG: VCBS repeat-containing protein [Verrucomicrobiaceae bacterium]|nr:VCBS repeat-containing protein [Verrucomicrobiaceae bacterium]